MHLVMRVNESLSTNSQEPICPRHLEDSDNSGLPNVETRLGVLPAVKQNRGQETILGKG